MAWTRLTRATAAGALLLGVVGALPAGAATARAPRTGVQPVDLDHLLEPEDRRPREEPSIAVDPADPRTVVVASMQFSRTFAESLYSGYSPRARVWRSRNGGRSYRALADLPVPPGAAAVSLDPRLAWDPHGGLYAVYTASSREYGKAAPEDGLYLARSSDAGAHWPDAVRVQARGCGGPSRPGVAVDPRRSWLYLVWTQTVEPSCDGSPDQTRTEVRWARSTDHGAHFSAPVRVTEPGVGRFPGLAVLPDGDVLVSYVSGGTLSLGSPGCPGVQEVVQVTRFTPAGRALGTATPIEALCDAYGGLFGNGAAYLPVEDPSLAVDPSTGAAVLASTFQGYSGSGVETAVSHDGGRTWVLQPVTGLPGSSASMATVTVARGRAALEWLEVEPGGAYQPQLATSADDGAHWGPPVALAALPSYGNSHPQSGADLYGIGRYLGLALGGDGVAHAAWPDLRPRASTDVDVWTREVTVP